MMAVQAAGGAALRAAKDQTSSGGMAPGSWASWAVRGIL